MNAEWSDSVPDVLWIRKAKTPTAMARLTSGKVKTLVTRKP